MSNLVPELWRLNLRCLSGYDALNRLTNMVDEVGTTVYAYTSAGQLYTEDGPFVDDTVTNIYLNHLRVGLGLQQPTGFWTNAFGYDAAKRLTNVTSPAGVFSYEYNPTRLGLVTNLSLPNGSCISNTFDPVARLLGTFLITSGGSTLDSSTYGYNVGGQRTNFVNAAATSVTNAYDPIGQLTIVQSSATTEDRGYLYDTAWNLNHLTNNGTETTFSLNDKNELTGEGGSTTFSYDLNGNLITIAVGGSATTTLFYDNENRLMTNINNGGADETT